LRPLSSGYYRLAEPAVDLLELTALIAQKDPKRHARVSARWLARWLEMCDKATIDEAAFVTAALVALGGNGHETAYAALLDVAERASRRPVGQTLTKSR
jgi:hypothetical protein